MNSSDTDYTRLYNFQDRFLSWFASQNLPFYLTGGTALGRFYLNHRYSNDLDFFVNDDAEFQQYIEKIRKSIGKQFKLDIQHSLFADDYTRIFIEDNALVLKIEFVNEVKYRAGTPVEYIYGFVDTPENILANKLSAIMGRDEPKDIFDIIYLAVNYSFDWQEMFYHTKNKTVINEVDVDKRLTEFPVVWIENVHWVKEPPDTGWLQEQLNTIANDFLLGKPNSLGRKRPPLQEAKPII